MELLIKLKAKSNVDNILKYLKKQDAVNSIFLQNDIYNPKKVIFTNKEMVDAMFKTSCKSFEKFFDKEPEGKIF